MFESPNGSFFFYVSQLNTAFHLLKLCYFKFQVKLFPGDTKFESQMQDTSWPVWNEDFLFQIDTKKFKKHKESTDLSLLNGYFVSLTVYAVLEVATPAKDDKKKKNGKNETNSTENAESTSTLAKFERLMSSSFKGSSKSSQGSSSSPEKRRMVGVATWTFDLKLFQNNLKNNFMGTPDLWRPVEQMGSGLTPVNGLVIFFILSNEA